MQKYFTAPLAAAFLLALGIAYLLSPTNPQHEVLPHLLALVVGISGVTVPMIILYRSDPPNIRKSIAEQIEAYYRKKGILIEEFSDAALAAHANPASTGKLLLIIEAAYLAREEVDEHTGQYRPFPEQVRKWFLENMNGHQVWFTFLMDAETDQPIAIRYLYVLVALSLLCFLALYFIYCRIDFPGDGTTERFLVLMTFFTNVATYLVVGQFAQERTRLEKMIAMAITRLCPETISAIERYKDHKAQLRDNFLKSRDYSAKKTSKPKTPKNPGGK